MPRCHAHAWPFEADEGRKEEDFQCVPVSEWQTFMAGKAVRAALRERADPEGSLRDFQAQQRAKYIDPTKVK